MSISLNTPAGKEKVTIVEVAEEAGVSVSAVSRAFNPEASCSDNMRAKVMAAAQQLGYKPNRLARGIRAQSRLIGILMADFCNPAYLPILNDFTLTLQQAGYHSLLLNVGEDMDIREAMELVMEYQVDGLIVTSSTLSPELVEICHEQQTPVITFARHSRNNPVMAVCCDNVSGGNMAAETLSAAGYQNFAYISGVPGATTTLDRQRGFIGRLVELGHEQWQVVDGGAHSHEAGYQAACQLFNQDNPPDALFFSNDIMACGGMDAVRNEFGLRVPEDVGIMGFDDIQLAQNQAYNLTTIRQPFGDMVNTTVEKLLEGIKDNESRVEKTPVILPCELIVRGSVR
uniref:LacI family transcriptional regulator n=1 Tax=uncultured Thiotrichaceae bacterium TaxID=298394 RepID=A0A6S6SZ74_9GAMM|nr:MAG: LacI family transcriptional regulator [uncultured Thiotrichaceae bacterium]